MFLVEKEFPHRGRSGKGRMRIGQLLVLAAVLIAAGTADAYTWDFQTRMPLRFTYTYSEGEGFRDEELHSPWIPLSPILEGQVFLDVGDTPYALDVAAELVMEVDSAEVYAGNLVPFRTWVEPLDDPDTVGLHVNYGFSFGIRVRPMFDLFGKSLSVTKDFSIRIDNDGLLPLGTNYLGGYDYVKFLQFPFSSLIPGGSLNDLLKNGIKAVPACGAKAMLGNFLAIELAGEMVIEGSHVQTMVDGNFLVNSNYGAGFSATNFFYVPMTGFDYGSETFELPVVPRLSYNVFMGHGASLGLLPGVTIECTPGMADRLSTFLSHEDYTPPDWWDLHNADKYREVQHGAAVGTCDGTEYLAIPINQRPNIPNIAIRDIIFNPATVTDPTYEKVYAAETTTVRFTVINIGERATQTNGEFQVDARLDGEYVLGPIMLNTFDGQEQCVMDVNESTNFYFQHVFTEGVHTMYLRTGYIETKGWNGTNRITGIGDCYPPNNMIHQTVYALPPRGTVIGETHGNPDYPIGNIPVWLRGDATTLCVTSAPPGVNEGSFRFDKVPSGDYLLEFMTVPPTHAGMPDYFPLSYRFHHDAGALSDFRSSSGVFLVQYQTLLALVKDTENNAIPDVTVEYLVPALKTTNTSATGRFEFHRVPPRGDLTLTLLHNAYEPKRIHTDLHVDSTGVTNTWIWGYYDEATSNWINGSTITLARDTTPPAVDFEPFMRGGACTTSLVVRFNANDSGLRLPREYKWRVKSPTNETYYLGNFWIEYPLLTNNELWVEEVIDITSLAQGDYLLELTVRDPASNAMVLTKAFWRDTAAPSVAEVRVADGAAFTAANRADVLVRLAQPEAHEAQVRLSNDNATWGDPVFFTGSNVTVRMWPLTDLVSTNIDVTVYARVSDAAGNTASGSDIITVDSSDRATLAGGCDFWTTLSVPLAISITPPAEEQIYWEPGGFSIVCGSAATNRFLAQSFTLASSATVSRLEMGAQRNGSPGDLQVKLVWCLDNGNPTCPACQRFAATVPANTVPTNQFTSLVFNLDPPAGLPAGTGYLLVYSDTESASNHYLLSSYYSDYSPNHAPSYYYSSVWTLSPTQAFVGMRTISFSLIDDRPGDYRVAQDGLCDTEPWQPYDLPGAASTTLLYSTMGYHSVCVDYRSERAPDLNRTYYDMVCLDDAPPACTVTVLMADAENGLLHVALDASDEHSGLSTFRWSLTGGWPWSNETCASTYEIPFTGTPSNLFAYVIDRAGLTSSLAVASVPDVFPPTLQLSFAGGGYTRTPTTLLYFAATDSHGASNVTLHLQEMLSEKDYPPVRGAPTNITVVLPKQVVEVTTGIVTTWLDGVYDYWAMGTDDAGNNSTTVYVRTTLDRTAPVIHSAWLTGSRREGFTTTKRLLLSAELHDNLSPLSLCYRFEGQDWSAWYNAGQGLNGRYIDGPEPMPDEYRVDLKVRDAAGNETQTVASIAVNHPPAQPHAIAPVTRSGGVTPLLLPSEFSDEDGDTFLQAWFRLWDVGTWTELINTGPIPTATYRVPAGLLEWERDYMWTVAYQDSAGVWSYWSPQTNFVTYGDQDGDEIDDEIEIAGCTLETDWDSDGDGISDGVEDRNHNGIKDAGEMNPCSDDSDEDKVRDDIEDANHNGVWDSEWETNPLASDTDGDGLADGEEDESGDGIWDPLKGETDPRQRDTDSDGMDDGSEKLSGTNPLDINACLELTGIAPVPTHPDDFDIIWRARGGLTYQIWLITNLTDLAGMLLHEEEVTGGTNPWYEVDASFRDKTEDSPPAGFYMIRYLGPPP